MKIKLILAIGILIGVAGAGYSVYNMNMSMAILSIIGVFTLTNKMRAEAFKDSGFMKEAKWMNIISVCFAVLFLIVLVVTVIL